MKAVPNNKGVLIASNEPKGKLIEVGVGVGFGVMVGDGVGVKVGDGVGVKVGDGVGVGVEHPTPCVYDEILPVITL